MRHWPRLFSILSIFSGLISTAYAAAENNHSEWRAARDSELREIIPARAPVEKERIETEFRTASGITDGKGKYVAGVVLITAGYAAEGKYSHFLIAQVPVKIGQLQLSPGEYVFGWQRGEDALTVKFYNAQTGVFLGEVTAERVNRTGRIESFHIYPPGGKPLIQIGRFAMAYEIGE
ncbi:MAG: hypothetical protein JO270_17470 [Acidobacteriaceae bacterium]|nr:hypothetical protein [Acidobacteriaceae bacterium]MBV8569104.1 hypothetical protein [Acidobacteriaceae bacterium]